jgi:pre-mRNA-splicing factor CWC22
VSQLTYTSTPADDQIEMCNMIIECCSQERSYSQFYGLIGERFCKLNRVWTENFQEAFQKYYDTIHRYETNKLRNIGRFFGHLLASDGISWAVLHVVHMNEEETTSSSRIFVKILMQEMIEEMGIAKMVERFRIPDMRPAFAGMFPTDNPKNTRFAINYFTSIGMGKVTEDMRTWLQNAPKMLAAQHAALKAAESSSDSDSSSDISSSDLSSSSDSDSDSDDGGRNRRKPRRSPSDSRSPPRRRRRYTSESRSPSPPPRRRSPPPPRKRSVSPAPNRRESPPRRVRRYSRRAPPPVKDERSPPRRAPVPTRDERSPPRRAPPPGRDDRSPPRRAPLPRDDRSPPPRRRRYDDSPSRSPPRRRRESSTPPRRR